MRNIVIRMFEEYKSDQELYTEVFTLLGTFDKILDEKGPDRGKSGHYDKVVFGNWHVEGDVNLSENIGCIERDYYFYNNSNDDSIYMDLTYCNEVTDSGTDTNAGPYEETKSSIAVSELNYHRDGEDHAISVTSEMKKLIENIITKIQS